RAALSGALCPPYTSLTNQNRAKDSERGAGFSLPRRDSSRRLSGVPPAIRIRGCALSERTSTARNRTRRAELHENRASRTFQIASLPWWPLALRQLAHRSGDRLEQPTRRSRLPWSSRPDSPSFQRS